MIDYIFREYGDEYIDEFYAKIPGEHVKVISAIQRYGIICELRRK